MRKLSKRSEEATNTVLTFATGSCTCYACSCGCKSSCGGSGNADYYASNARTTANMQSSNKSSWGKK